MIDGHVSGADGARAAPRNDLLCFAAGLLSATLISISIAYSDEDAFISFRVVENVMHGYGLRWNIDERVQVFSHPLWLFVDGHADPEKPDAISAGVAG